MTERRLPPALEKKLVDVSPQFGGFYLSEEDLLDWLDGTEEWTFPEGSKESVRVKLGLVERVMNRTNELFESGWDIETAVEDALRAEIEGGLRDELADEASAALDKLKGKEP